MVCMKGRTVGGLLTSGFVALALALALLQAAVLAQMPRPDPVTTNSVPAAHHSANHGIAGSIGHAAATFGFPLVLALLVIAFVAVQRRLDRKDPKLALASSEPDTVRFL